MATPPITTGSSREAGLAEAPFRLAERRACTTTRLQPALLLARLFRCIQRRKSAYFVLPESFFRRKDDGGAAL